MVAHSLTRESGAESEGEKNRVEGDGGWVAKFAVALVRCYEADRRHKRDSELGTKFLTAVRVKML